MKLAMFTTKESYVTWLKREIEAIRNNGLRQAKEAYEAALQGKGKESWMKLNNIDIDNEEVWIDHLYYLRDQVEYLENKIKKYQREIVKNS